MKPIAVIVWLVIAAPCWAYQEPSSDAITLRQYIDIRIEAVESARGLAYQSMEKRLEGMNEFRDTLKDQAALFVTRRELDPIQADIRELREKAALGEGKASQQSVFVATGISVIGTVIALAAAVATFMYRKGG